MNGGFFMKTEHIPVITEWRLVMILILALLPCVGCMMDKASTDEELREFGEFGGHHT